MKLLLTILILSGCSQSARFKINDRISVDKIKIEPVKSKSVYRVEKYI